jgi:hypothetical protein
MLMFIVMVGIIVRNFARNRMRMVSTFVFYHDQC